MFTDKLKGNTVHKVQYLLDSMFPLKKRCIISRTESYCIDTILVEESCGDLLGGENRKGLGGICKELRLPSNISTTLLIDGRFEGSVCMHHKLTIIIFLALFSSSSFERQSSPNSSFSSRCL